MNALPTQTKKIWILGLFAALVSVFFSFMGAPFVRAFFAKTKPPVFWMVGVALVGTLVLVQLTLGAIYVGAVWMTLGCYSELETRGVSWKKTGAVSVIFGMLFATMMFYIFSKTTMFTSIMSEMTEPILRTLNQLLPEKKYTAEEILVYMPGLFASVLVSTIAAGLAFESRIFQLFQLRREKTITGLRWLEFRWPDSFLWLSLTSFFLALIDLNGVVSQSIAAQIKLISLNISILSLVGFFIQGLIVVEFLSRFYRFGQFTKLAVYLMIFVWIGPVVSLLGLMDYWVDFRKRVRLKIK